MQKQPAAALLQGNKMKLTDWIRDRVLRNPAAWFFFALFLLAEYWNYEKGKQLDRVCELTGPHEAVVAKPTTDREELGNICLSRGHDPFEE